ncbi:hypothetical protein, partial [Mesomycoplasma ovipneumoniae]|uniref:hypothetical protein n=1 Tax=Mesomycoplasma ovipneumoniae TaxID=29562 RepID=UPI003CC7FA28
PSDYKRMGDFKQKVLDSSIKQINQNTSLIVAYEQHKQGRLITAFTFSFSKKEAELNSKSNKNPDVFRDPNTIDCVDNLTDLERNNHQNQFKFIDSIIGNLINSKSTNIKSPKESYLTPKEKDEEEIIKSKKTYSAKNKLSKEHEKNLIKQARKEHREYKEQEEAIKHQEKEQLKQKQTQD